MPQDPAAAPQEVAPDRERDAGFRGDAFTTAAWLFGLVFVVGFAVVAFVLLRSRRPRA